jgi:hypothetical protein
VIRNHLDPPGWYKLPSNWQKNFTPEKASNHTFFIF